MAIKGLVGKDGNTLGTQEQPWEKLFVKNIEAEPIELKDGFKTNYTFDGKPVYEKWFSFTTGEKTGTSYRHILGNLGDIEVVNYDIEVRISSTDQDCKCIWAKIPHYNGTTTQWFSLRGKTNGDIDIYDNHASSAYSSCPAIVKVQYVFNS